MQIPLCVYTAVLILAFTVRAFAREVLVCNCAPFCTYWTVRTGLSVQLRGVRATRWTLLSPVPPSLVASDAGGGMKRRCCSSSPLHRASVTGSTSTWRKAKA